MEIPGSEVVGVDISEDALEVACSQDFEEFQKSRSSIRFVKGDILEPDLLPELGKFDLILSNPPYIKESEKAKMRPNVLDHEPALALFVPDEDPLLFYRAIARYGMKNLCEGGMLFFEINAAYGHETCELLETFGYKNVTLRKDINDRERMIFATK